MEEEMNEWKEREEGWKINGGRQRHTGLKAQSETEKFNFFNASDDPVNVGDVCIVLGVI